MRQGASAVMIVIIGPFPGEGGSKDTVSRAESVTLCCGLAS